MITRLNPAKFTFGLLFFMAHLAGASTFVGNGGNAGDVELQIAINEIRDTMKSIEEYQESPDEKLCVCEAQFQGRPMCEPLQNLSNPQRDFCSNFLKKKSTEILGLLQGPASAHFTWTHNEIEVSEGASLRAADAIAQFPQKRITLSQKRFLELSSAERTFLLTHELFHLTEWQNRPVTDEQVLGPFTQIDGGRQLLNSLAAGLVMESERLGISRKFNSDRERSKSSKSHWINFEGGNTETHSGSNSSFNLDQLNSNAFTYRYQTSSPWGFSVRLGSARGKKTILGTLQGLEDQSSAALAATYRLFPSNDILSFWGQSHFLIAFGFDTLRGTYTLQDDSVSTSSSVTSSAVSASLSFYAPWKYGIWVYLQLGYLSHSYNYVLAFPNVPSSTVNYDKNPTTSVLGVSYGF